MVLPDSFYDDVFYAMADDEEKVGYYWKKLYKQKTDKFPKYFKNHGKYSLDETIVDWIHFTHPVSRNKYLLWYTSTPRRILWDRLDVSGGAVLIVEEYDDRNFYISTGKARPRFVYHITSHFLKRYRERCLMDDVLPTEEVLIRYIDRNMHNTVSIENNEITVIPVDDPNTHSVLAHDGVVFIQSGKLIPTDDLPIFVFRCKTIVSQSIFNEKQEQYIKKLTRELHEKEVRAFLNIKENNNGKTENR